MVESGTSRGIASLKTRKTRRTWTAALVAPVLVLALAGAGTPRSNQPNSAATVTSPLPRSLALPPNPDAVCAECHRKIYDSYEKTAMARGSGSAGVGLPQGGYFDPSSGVRYRVFMRGGKAWLTYDRDASRGRPALHGRRRLLLYLGSGDRGRAYLYEVNGQWFETRINYYSLIGKWQIAPGNTPEGWMSSPLLIDSSCLHCHANAVQTPLPGAENRFAGLPFRQAGVGCSSCHGDATEHIATFGAVPVVDPAKLASKQRDSVCLQCHIEGDVAVFRAGKSLLQFKPGDDLSQFVTYFVKAEAQAGGRRAVSQYEALMRSACKRASGDRLTCITCHDPHYEPAAADRVRYYRRECLTCHTGVKMATEHFPQQPDCTVCHMPARETTDISHDELTDHDIEARPVAVESATDQSNAAGTDNLVPVLRGSISDRALGLAYAQLAERGDRDAGEKALRLLLRAESEGSGDAQVHTQLGFLQQMSGNAARASREYAAALAQDPDDVTALANLAVLEASAGRADVAVNLLERVVADDPSRTAAGLNLAFIDCRLGRNAEARDALRKVQALNPDNPALVEFETEGTYEGERCKIQ